MCSSDLYYAADPLISVIVGLLILSSSWVLIRDSVDVLLEGTPSHINIVNLHSELRSIEGVQSVHDLHVWTLTSGVLAMSCHIVIGSDHINRTALLGCVNSVARDHFHIDHTTVQLEDASAPGERQESCNCHFGAWDASITSGR